MLPSFVHERVVEFADTDMAGIMHFSNYFRFMEVAEHVYFRSLGLSLHVERDDGRMEGLARVHAECDYDRPLRYGDRIAVDVYVTSLGEKSIHYGFAFRLLERHEKVEAHPPITALGRLSVVAITKSFDKKTLETRPIPDNVRQALTVTPAQAFESLAFRSGSGGP